MARLREGVWEWPSRFVGFLGPLATLLGRPVRLLAMARVSSPSRTWASEPGATATGEQDGECQRFWARLQEQLRRRPIPCVRRCPAGLSSLAVPVVIGGATVALLACCGLHSSRPVLQRLDRSLSGCNRSRRSLSGPALVSAPARLHAAKQLLVLLAQNLAEGAASPGPAQPPGEPPCVTCGRHYVQHHLCAEGRTREAALQAHVTEPYFCRAFKTATGLTFSEYTARSRVQRAKQLLAEHALSVTEVAFAAGFQSIPHFNHTFKRLTGVSPSAYRACCRRNPAPCLPT